MSVIFPAVAAGPRLGLGGAPLGNLFQAISDNAARDVVHAAIADGCRTFDTAPHYGNGLSEHRFGTALRLLPAQRRVLSTKVGRILTPDIDAARDQNSYVDVLPFEQHWDYSAGGIRRSVEDSMQRLGVARIDVAFIHDCDAITHGSRYPQVLQQVVDAAIPTLRQLRRENLVGHFGLGVNDVAVCLDVIQRADIDCLLLAGRYSLIDHSALPQLLPLCTQRGIRIALGGAFNSGILATGVLQAPQPVRFNYAAASAQWIARTAAIETLCRQFAVPLRAAALQFPLAHPAIDVVVVGAQSVEQWADAMKMVSHPIPAAFWDALKAQGLLPRDAPTPVS